MYDDDTPSSYRLPDTVADAFGGTKLTYRRDVSDPAYFEITARLRTPHDGELPPDEVGLDAHEAFAIFCAAFIRGVALTQRQLKTGSN